MTIKEEIISNRVPPGNTGRRKIILGIGINDVPWRSQYKDGEKIIFDPSYLCWKNILIRCYSKVEHARKPTYVGCKIHESWKYLSKFDEWFLENYREGYSIDKDLLFPGNKVYSPDTCIFVPQIVNSFVLGSEAARGKFSVGVSYHKRIQKFQSSCNNPFNNGQDFLGYFLTEEEAHQAWLKRKLEHVETMKEELDSIDLRLYEAVKFKVRSLK